MNLTLRPGGPGGPGSPEAPVGPYKHTNKQRYLSFSRQQVLDCCHSDCQILCVQWNCQYTVCRDKKLLQFVNVLLTALPGSPLSPFGPGAPSAP